MGSRITPKQFKMLWEHYVVPTKLHKNVLEKAGVGAGGVKFSNEVDSAGFETFHWLKYVLT